MSFESVFVKIGVVLVFLSSILLIGSIFGLYPGWLRGTLLIVDGFGILLLLPKEWRIWKNLLLSTPVWYRNPLLTTVLGSLCILGGIFLILFKI